MQVRRTLALSALAVGVVLVNLGLVGVALASVSTLGHQSGGNPPIEKVDCSVRPKAAKLTAAVAAGASRHSVAGHKRRQPKVASGATPDSTGMTTITRSASPTTPATKSSSATPSRSATKSGSPSPSNSNTGSSTPSPSPSTSSTSSSPAPTVKSSPTPSSTSKSPKSPTASSTPSPSPSTSSPSTSPSPSPSTSSPPPAKVKPQLCVAVQAYSVSGIRPGHTASYAIWVWSTHGTSKDVAVTIAAGRAKYVQQPGYSICPSVKARVCSLGSLPVGQADELQAVVKVGKKAALGEQVELIAKAAGHRDLGFRATASVVVLAPVSPSTQPSAPSTIPPVTLPAIPGTSPTDPSGLFPTVSPSTGTSDPATSHGTKHAQLATAANATPLDSRFIGGQLAGLAVLAGAITIAIARLSLRPAKPAPADQGAGEPTAGSDPAGEDKS